MSVDVVACFVDVRNRKYIALQCIGVYCSVLQCVAVC